MEKTNSISSHECGSGDERDGQRGDEQPTTSRGDTLNPEEIAHNMNDMKPMDFNSADEVRQAMKTILAGKLPPPPFSEEGNHFHPRVQNNLEHVNINEIVQKNEEYLAHNVHTTVQQKVQQNLYQIMKTNKKPNNFGSTKRPGRPPKAGPSKQITKQKISSMYLGKLSNVVPFRREYPVAESESDVDLESVVLFY